MNIIGEGIGIWNRTERQSGRYGRILLAQPRAGAEKDPGYSGPAGVCKELPQAFPLRRREGVLLALVLESRRSSHDGDMLRDIRPRQPKVGDLIELGSGIFEAEVDDTMGPNATAFGVRPVGVVHRPSGTLLAHQQYVPAEELTAVQFSDTEAQSFMDIQALYNIHDQTVRIYFMETT